jgi:hypothetical protein
VCFTFALPPSKSQRPVKTARGYISLYFESILPSPPLQSDKSIFKETTKTVKTHIMVKQLLMKSCPRPNDLWLKKSIKNASRTPVICAFLSQDYQQRILTLQIRVSPTTLVLIPWEFPLTCYHYLLLVNALPDDRVGLCVISLDVASTAL